MLTKDEVIAILREGQQDINFITSDGSIRGMSCTLAETMVPKVEADPSKPKRKPNPDVQVVYDLYKGAWRSFRWDRLLEVNGIQVNFQEEVA
jgi:hypothetical protein